MSIYTKYIQFLGVNMRKDAEELIERYGKPIVKCKDCGKEFTAQSSNKATYCNDCWKKKTE